MCENSQISMPYYEALPGNLVPYHYEIAISDINTKANTFTGSVDIHLSVKSATNELHLNYRDLIVKPENVHLANNKCVSVTELKEREALVVKFDKSIDPVATSNVVVSITYNAFIQTNMTGFYRSEYIEDGQEKVMLCTQFEAPDARRTFPCFDEPDLKATYDITLTVPQHWTALANMPVKSEKLEGELKTVSFETTPKVSSYLVAWACGEFEYVETFTEDNYYDEKPLPIRIYTTKGYTSKAKYALEIAPKIVDFYSKIFDLKYPLPKLDLIAVHSFSHNAMENWGLITYRSNALLFDEETSVPSFKKQVCYVVAHEIAHMWFGDMVTMKWWDELWLNEGFATWVGYVAVDFIEPKWQIFDLVTLESLQQALTLDGLRSSHPIYVPVKNAVDVDQIFDHISYYKGCSIINMISTYLGKDVFLKGVSKYLKRNQFGNGTTIDLWQAVSEVSGKDVTSMMENWVQKIGFPLVEVEEVADGKIQISQKRFLSTGDVESKDDETTWWIPLNSDDPKLDNLTTKSAIFDISESTIKINNNADGFYRVHYTPEVIKKLPLQSFNARDKIGFFSDLQALAISGCSESNAVTLLEALESMLDNMGENYTVWMSIQEIFKRLQIVFGDLSKFKIKIFDKIGAKLLQEVQKNGIDDSDFGRVQLITTVFNVCGGLHIPEFVSYAKELFGKWKKQETIPACLNFFTLSTVASLEDFTKEDFDIIAKEIISPRSLDSRELAVKALPCISNLEHLPTLLEMIKDPTIVPLMDCHYMAQGLSENGKTRDLFWQYFKDNYADFYKELSTNVPIIERFVRFTFVNYQSEEMVKDLETFYGEKGIVGFERSYGQAVDTVRSNAKWFARDGQKVQQFVNKQ